MKSKTVEFPVVDMNFRREYSRMHLSDLGITASSWNDYAKGQIVAEVKARLLQGKIIEETKEIRYPADWWQAVKERFFPARLLNRYPVEYHTESIPVKITRVCPHNNVQGHLEHVRFLNCEDEPERPWIPGVSEKLEAKE